jgi:hypothetical protein
VRDLDHGHWRDGRYGVVHEGGGNPDFVHVGSQCQ